MIGALRAIYSRHNKNDVTDIIFLCVDHFELAGKPDRLNAWVENYHAIANKHCDSSGVKPKHTWFYALDLMHEDELIALKPLVDADLGEIELHWHHSHDTSFTFTDKLRKAMATFHKHGYMLPYKKGQNACFSFIHGNWSLGNSRGPEFCGVDDEIEILKNEGCYADFTFPALFNIAQPHLINSLHYCNIKPTKNSYKTGRPAKVGVKACDDEFLIFQGPLTINWRDWRHCWHPTFEDGDLHKYKTHDDPKRIDAWINQHIHVEERPEWVFVKTFCHGAQDHKSVLSDTTDRMFKYLEENYNDGVKYRLHYVSAREAYNIVKAAEAGQSGNPHDFRDYVIPHPLKR
jgi:hypothetical protein